MEERRQREENVQRPSKTVELTLVEISEDIEAGIHVFSLAFFQS